MNNLEEAEKFYGEILGLKHVGRLATSPQSCFRLGDHNIILCQRRGPLVRTVEQDGRIELGDASWKAGMPTPICEEIVNS